MVTLNSRPIRMNVEFCGGVGVAASVFLCSEL